MSHSNNYNSTQIWDSVKVADPVTGVEYAYVARQLAAGSVSTVPACSVWPASFASCAFFTKELFDPNHVDDLFSHLNGTISVGDYLQTGAYSGGYLTSCMQVVDKITEVQFDSGNGTTVCPDDFDNFHGVNTGCPCTLAFLDLVVMNSTGTPSPYATIHNNCADCQGQSVVAAISGCTDSTAINYDATATVDDGSCIFVRLGCMDSTALNYNAAANTDDGSCVYPVLGCTDITAQNYNALANSDDGSCIYCIYGCTSSTALNFNPLATCDNGTCIACINGCMNANSANYNPNATCDDGSCSGCVYGCTDSNSSNFDATATCDDGSCCIDGCTNPKSINYNVLATCDDGSCTTCVYGCMDTSALNYSALATCDDGSCLESECSDCFKLLNVLYNEAKCEGCTEDDYMIEEKNLQRFTNLRLMRDLAYECGDQDYIDIMSFEEYELCSTLLDEHTNEKVNDYKIYGCTNPASLNYNAKATHPCEKNNILNFCCGETSTVRVSGCTDPLATNYNPSANIDDGLCFY